MFQSFLSKAGLEGILSILVPSQLEEGRLRLQNTLLLHVLKMKVAQGHYIPVQYTLIIIVFI